MALRTERDRLVTQHMPLADKIAKGFARKYQNLIERDDAMQVARLALVRAAGMIVPDRNPTGYLSVTINGALHRYLRDRSRLVRVPAKEHAKGIHPLTHISLDAPDASGGCLLDDLADQKAGKSADGPSWLAQILDQLPAPQAALLRLRFMEGASMRAASRELGVSLQTIQNRQKKLLPVLRQMVGEQP